jgi:dienelactone hydrolase
MQYAGEPGRGAETLQSTLFLPEGKGPFPAVIGLHGCGGLTKSSGALDDRFADWGRRLAGQGYAVLFPDSFASRGVTGGVCHGSDEAIRPAYERAADARASLAYLQSRPDIRANRVSLMGWSHGAITGLWSVTPKSRKSEEKPDFARAILFYPGCKSALDSATWSARMPVLILSGKADDWTPATPCEALAAKFPDRIRMVLYDGAYHEFDHPGMAVHEVTGLPRSSNPSGIAHAGTNKAAREDAIKRVTEELKQP